MSSLLVGLAIAGLAVGGQVVPPVPAGAVTGRIVDVVTGEPIQGARVSLSPVRGPASPAPPASPTVLRALMNQTSVDGMFEVSGVPGASPPAASALGMPRDRALHRR